MSLHHSYVPGAVPATSDFPDETRIAQPSAPRRWRQVLPWILGAAVGAGGLITVLSASGGIDDVRQALERVTLGWTLAALFAMLIGYLLLAAHMRRLSPVRLTFRRAARADLLLFGLGNLLPGAPAPGALLAARELRRAGIPPRQVRFVLGFTAWFNIRTLLGLGAVTALVTFAREHPALRNAGLWWLAAIAVLVLLVESARLASRQHTAERVARLVGRVRIGRLAPPIALNTTAAAGWHAEAKALVGTPVNRVLLALLALGSWLADAACLWLALAAAGIQLDVDVVLLAYVAGILASGIPFLPGGLGAVEAMIPAVLHHFGAPLDAALAGTLVYRGISALLPALAGALLLAGPVIGNVPRSRRRRS